jgi:hypothetical protein
MDLKAFLHSECQYDFQIVLSDRGRESFFVIYSMTKTPTSYHATRLVSLRSIMITLDGVDDFTLVDLDTWCSSLQSEYFLVSEGIVLSLIGFFPMVSIWTSKEFVIGLFHDGGTIQVINRVVDV